MFNDFMYLILLRARNNIGKFLISYITSNIFGTNPPPPQGPLLSTTCPHHHLHNRSAASLSTFSPFISHHCSVSVTTFNLTFAFPANHSATITLAWPAVSFFPPPPPFPTNQLSFNTLSLAL